MHLFHPKKIHYYVYFHCLSRCFFCHQKCRKFCQKEWKKKETNHPQNSRSKCYKFTSQNLRKKLFNRSFINTFPHFFISVKINCIVDENWENPRCLACPPRAGIMCCTVRRNVYVSVTESMAVQAGLCVSLSFSGWRMCVFGEAKLFCFVFHSIFTLTRGANHVRIE